MGDYFVVGDDGDVGIGFFNFGFVDWDEEVFGEFFFGYGELDIVEEFVFEEIDLWMVD